MPCTVFHVIDIISAAMALLAYICFFLFVCRLYSLLFYTFFLVGLAFALKLTKVLGPHVYRYRHISAAPTCKIEGRKETLHVVTFFVFFFSFFFFILYVIRIGYTGIHIFSFLLLEMKHFSCDRKFGWHTSTQRRRTHVHWMEQ